MEFDDDKFEQEEIDEMKETGETNETQDNERNNNTPKKPKLPGLVGGMIGGVISAIIVIALFTSNIIPLDVENTEKNHDESIVVNKNEAPPIANMDTTPEYDSSNINDISKAVVGVANLQQQSIWTTSEEAGVGSGIIYKKENDKAYVVTNNHVVKDAEEVEVVLDDDERIKAKVLGTDELSDLAILEVDGEHIDYTASLGSSEDLLIGDTVLAIGNPLGMEFSGSVTKGIISGLNRSVEIDTTGDGQPDWITEVIQTDAAINPGNSGGALVNTEGNVIGINSMKIASHQVEGIGFAIPIDSALPIMQQLKENGEVARPFIGITTVELNQVPPQYRENVTLPEDIKEGMVIANVQTGSSADQSGLQQFDIITKIDDKEITSTLDLRKYMYSKTEIGDTITLEIYRDGEQQSIKLKLTERTD